MEYTDAQRAAIGTLDEPLLIVACAGSGKTQVISQRIVEILRLPGVEPKNIVAFTFTEKAAAELKERVTTLTTAAFGEMTGLAEMFIGTMHGYARDLLQTWVPDAFKRNVLSDIQTRLFIDRNSRASGLTVTDAVVNGHAEEAAAVRQLAAVDAGARHPPRGRRGRDTAAGARCPRRCSGTGSCCADKNYFDFTELLAADGRPARRRRRRRHGRGADPARPRSRPVRRGGRVPGHEPDPGEADRAALPVRGEPVRGRRRRPDDLPVARQRGRPTS